MEEVARKVDESLVPRIEEHVSSEEFDAGADELDFLTTKNSVMLSYLIELTHNTMKRGKDPASIKRLIEMKVVLDKTRPLEKKLKYQLDKLLAAGSTSSSYAVTASQLSEDALSFSANPEAMKDGDTTSESDSGDLSSDSQEDNPANEEEKGHSDEDDDLAAAKATLQLARAKQQGKKFTSESQDDENGVYRAPRMAAVPYPNSAGADQQREHEKRIARKRRQTELAQALRDQYGDAPEQEDIHGGSAFGQQRESARRMAQREKEKTEYEESTMVRLMTSRKDKKERKRLMRQESSNLSAISDLGNLARGVSEAFDDDEDFSGRRSSRSKSRGTGSHQIGVDSRMKKRKKNSIEARNSFQKALFGKSDKKKKKKS